MHGTVGRLWDLFSEGGVQLFAKIRV